MQDSIVASTLRVGDLVVHPSYGKGRVMTIEVGRVQVYLHGYPSTNPNGRVIVFSEPERFLERLDAGTDPELDFLPAWDGKRFVQATKPLDFEGAVAKFLRMFPGGLDDAAYLRHERAYKDAAHKRWMETLSCRGTGLIDAGDGTAIYEAINAVYGDSKTAKDAPESRLNLLFQRVEEPAYFDALRADPKATVEYLRTTLAFLGSPGDQTFNSYIAALQALPTRKGGAKLDQWTTVTWLPFIADPTNHVLIKPTLTRAVAAYFPHEIHYDAAPNFRTYKLCVELGKRLLVRLNERCLNPLGRPLDMIDAQSFMWAVEKWTEADIKATR